MTLLGRVAALGRRRRQRAASGGGGAGFLHTFTAANHASVVPSADTGQATSVLAGTWGIDSNTLYLAGSSGGNNNAVVWDVGLADGTLSMLVTGGVSGRLVFRATDVDNLYIADFAPGAMEVYRRTTGSYNALPSGAFAGGITAGDTVAVILSGDDIVVQQNGVTRITTSHAFNNTATLHGVGAENTGATRYDDLTFTGAGVPATTARTFAGYTFAGRSFAGRTFVAGA
jgi:hypothetical protein